MSLWLLTALVVLLAPAQAVNMLYGGVAIKVDVPADGSIIRDSFEPVYSIEFHDGYLANAVREDPNKVHICAALDGRKLECRPVLGDGKQSVKVVEVGDSLGFGHHMHAFEVWLALENLSEHTGVSSYTSLMTVNATSLFSSATPGALHMPDDLSVYHAECYHERLASSSSSGKKISYSSSHLPLAKGILHIGANVANEAKGYAKCVGGGGSNVLFVECDPEVAKVCAANARKFGQRCINACLSDTNRNEVPFFQSGANGGMSSSLRTFDQHKAIFPGVVHDQSSTVKTWRYDDLVSSLPSGLLPDMNVLLIDAQGMEFEILTGMAAALAPPSSSRGGNGTGFEAAVVEVSHVSVYEGQHLGPEIDALMKSYGFQCEAHCEPCDHCDRLYFRSWL